MTSQIIFPIKSRFKPALCVLALASAGICISAVKPAYAGLNIAPQITELNTKQGQAQGSITMSNTDANPLKTNSYAVPFTYDRETGFKELQTAPSNLVPYLQLHPANITIPGTDKRRLRFTARLAPSLPDGEYRAMLFTEMGAIPLPDQPIAGNEEVVVSSTIVPRLGVAVYVRKGDVSPNLSVENARFNPQKQTIQLLVKNSGKASAFVTGTWTVKQTDREVFRSQLTNTTTVLAESDRYLNLALPSTLSELPAGQYELSGKILWGFNQSREIPYNLSFTIDANPTTDVAAK